MIKTLMISFTILLLAGCQPKRKAPELPPPHNPNLPELSCEEDRAGCKQYNPNKRKAPDLNPPPFDPNPPASNCAADGPGCKQFNPNKP